MGEKLTHYKVLRDFTSPNDIILIGLYMASDLKSNQRLPGLVTKLANRGNNGRL